jgi:MoxR-like ATPase
VKGAAARPRRRREHFTPAAPQRQRQKDNTMSEHSIKLAAVDGDAIEWNPGHDPDEAAAERARVGLEQLEAELNAAFPERAEIISTMITTLVAKQHMLMLGPPGNAKSALGRAMTAAIAGYYFEHLMTEFTDPGELFGPFSMQALQNDEYRRVTTGRLPSCVIAFLDEIFKANSAILNTLLTVINERKFHNGGQAIPIPLRTMICASNEVPEPGTGLDALFDRILARVYVRDIDEDENFNNVMWQERPAITARITLDDIEALFRVSQRLQPSQGVLEAIPQIRRKVKEKGIAVSPRRYVQLSAYLRAHAARTRQSDINTACLMPMADCLWSSHEQHKVVHDIVEEYAASWMRDIQRIRGELDQLAERSRKVNGDRSLNSARVFSEIGGVVDDLKARAKEIATLMGNADAASEAAKLAKLEEKYRREALEALKARS